MTRKNNYYGALQQPISSGFNATSTSEDVIQGVDLTGKIAIVTGGYSGIGLETTRTLAKSGATIIVPVRPGQKAHAKEALTGIENVEVEEIDLIDPVSIDEFANKFLASGRPLHLLINNAGIMFVPLRRDTRGIESQLATNYLATFHLTARLWDALKKANGARVINVSSQGHQFAPFHFDDPNFEMREYQTLSAYGQSKTAVNLFTLELDNQAREHNVRTYAVHPGNTAGTNLANEASLDLLQQIGLLDEDGNIRKVVADTLKTVQQGAATTIWCATNPLLDQIGGVYCEDANIAAMASDTAEGLSTGVKAYSLDENYAKRLWKLSEQMTGVTFGVN
jgi:NAD(P)-dependent dehydrogenase (short-subunit alcohol dehydrogenase family)